ncbi:MAG: hypothetical protein LUH15_06450 [Tannerellaceae bacterium]|nr:hypothetical protein [Tannerellaceae bacterium]
MGSTAEREKRLQCIEAAGCIETYFKNQKGEKTGFPVDISGMNTTDIYYDQKAFHTSSEIIQSESHKNYVEIDNGFSKNKINQVASVYMALHDPIGAANDICEDLSEGYTKLNCLLYAIKSGIKIEEIEALYDKYLEHVIDSEGKNKMSFHDYLMLQRSPNQLQNAENLFNLSLQLYHLLFNNKNESLNSHRGSTNRDALEKYLEVKKEKK